MKAFFSFSTLTVLIALIRNTHTSGRHRLIEVSKARVDDVKMDGSIGLHQTGDASTSTNHANISDSDNNHKLHDSRSILPNSTIPNIRFERIDFNDDRQVRALCTVWSDAFDDKRRWRCRSREKDINSKIQSIEEYKRNCPRKLDGICVAVERNEDYESGKVVGGICVGLHDQPGCHQWPDWTWYICKEKEAYIEWIGVDVNDRGRGIGKGLLQFSDNYARAHGCHVISLGVVKGNEAKRLYERWGYGVVDTDVPACCMCFGACILTGYCWGYDMQKSLVMDIDR